MFFGLEAIADHPCCKMQELVESFFGNSIQEEPFSRDLFPDWIHSTLEHPKSTLETKFAKVHTLLHEKGYNSKFRRAVYEQMLVTNRISELCAGTACIPPSAVDWASPLGEAITALMGKLYESLDLAVFRRNVGTHKPTHEFYGEFLKKNKYVCPFCGLRRFKNKRGVRREDFDHYLHKSDFPLAAANMKNIVPTCGTCNQDYKKTKNVLADGAAFFPYSVIPEVKVEIDCPDYPAIDNFSDSGKWRVNLSLVTPDEAISPKMATWERVYSVKKRLENEIAEFFEEWMSEVAEEHSEAIDPETYSSLIERARDKAIENKKRRMQPSQIVRAAFYDFILTKANRAFVESFRYLQNQKVISVS
jgi:hypothetical protein